MAYDVIVIGGGPAGLSAAVNVRARGQSVLVVSTPMQENPLWKAERVNNYLGLPGMTGAELLERFHSHAKQSGVCFKEGRAVRAMPMESDWFISIGSDVESAKAVVLASGVTRAKKYPGEAEYLGKGVSYCATCDGMLYRNRPVAVVGFSESAKKEAEFLTSIGCTVTYYDRPRQCEISGGDKVKQVICDGETAAVDCVFLLRPALAPADVFPGIQISNGYVQVDRTMATNLPGVFAAGDCTGGPLQVSRAVGEGLTAGQSAAKYAAGLARNQ